MPLTLPNTYPLQFVSEFFTYEPLENISQPPAHLVSPWSVLEWQVWGGWGLGLTPPMVNWYTPAAVPEDASPLCICCRLAIHSTLHHWPAR